MLRLCAYDTALDKILFFGIDKFNFIFNSHNMHFIYCFFFPVARDIFGNFNFGIVWGFAFKKAFLLKYIFVLKLCNFSLYCLIGRYELDYSL
jgi:hypothetical protein